MINIYWKKGARADSAALKAQVLGEDLLIKKGAYGKPYLEEGPFFNLSHSGDYIAIAIGEQELGLDLEAPRPIHHGGFIHPEEKGIDPLTLWVVKESFMKFTGEGIRQFRSVRAEPMQEGLYRVTDGKQIAFAKTLWIEQCIAAVCAAKIEEIKMEQIF